MKHKNVFKLALLLPLLIVLASCTDTSKVNVKSLNQERGNSLICPVEGGEVGLYSLDGESNMLNPKYVDNTVTGKVSLSKDYTYALTPSSFYTFVFYGDFNSLYRNEKPNCEGFDIQISYMNNYPHNETFSSGTTGSLKSVVDGSYERVEMKVEKDCSKMFLQFNTPYTSQSNITVKSFKFIFDNKGVDGKISSVQLYKGKINNYIGLDINYDNDPCLPSFDENYEGPFNDGYVYDIEFEYGYVPTVETLRKSLVAYDLAEGKYKQVTVDRDGLTGHESVLNNPLEVVFKSTDMSNNTSRFSYNVKIVDTQKPEIKVLNSSKKVSYLTKISDEFILENYEIRDNYPDGIKSIEVLDLDTSMTNYIGVLNFKIQATDISGNVQTVDGNIEIIDDVIPTINGPIELNLSSSEAKTMEQILENYTAEDTISGKLDIIVENETYTANKNKPGTYVINLKAVDKSGNVGKLSVKTVVQDKDGPIFYVNKTTITTFSKKTLSSEELLRSAIAQGALPDKNYTSCEIVEGEYGNVDEVQDYGTYNVKLLAHADDGTDEYVLITIDVKEQIQEELSFFEKVKIFFINIWNKIVSFFTNGF